ncbi:MAG: hypothetical protein CM15mP77_2310 [Synechococcus sp.]|nr:MAG: hypothetical protein CM15mP77_2310 [Synechococcus sp.]
MSHSTEPRCWSAVAQAPAMKLVAPHALTLPQQHPVLTWRHPAVAHLQCTPVGAERQESCHGMRHAVEVVQLLTQQQHAAAFGIIGRCWANVRMAVRLMRHCPSCSACCSGKPPGRISPGSGGRGSSARGLQAAGAWPCVPAVRLSRRSGSERPHPPPRHRQLGPLIGANASSGGAPVRGACIRVNHVETSRCSSASCAQRSGAVRMLQFVGRARPSVVRECQVITSRQSTQQGHADRIENLLQQLTMTLAAHSCSARHRPGSAPGRDHGSLGRGPQ